MRAREFVHVVDIRRPGSSTTVSTYHSDDDQEVTNVVDNLLEVTLFVGNGNQVGSTTNVLYGNVRREPF